VKPVIASTATSDATPRPAAVSRRVATRRCRRVDPPRSAPSPQAADHRRHRARDRRERSADERSSARRRRTLGQVALERRASSPSSAPRAHAAASVSKARGHGLASRPRAVPRQPLERAADRSAVLGDLRGVARGIGGGRAATAHPAAHERATPSARRRTRSIARERACITIQASGSARRVVPAGALPASRTLPEHVAGVGALADDSQDQRNTTGA